MTLTEEQREAIRVISKLPMAIGCQLCHPYIMENYGSHFIVLRDMIDSSGTVEPTGGFDLERARGLRDFLQDDCAEVGDVWGEMIAEIERLRGFETAARDLSNDLTRVAKERDELQEANTNFAFQASDQAQEIERLRTRESGLEQRLEWTIRDGFKKQEEQVAKIKELEGQVYHLVKELQVSENHLASCDLRQRSEEAILNRRIKELKADLEQSEICIQARLDVIDQQAARIKELEDAHKRSGKKYAKIINELRSSVYANIPGLDVGKIGPDAKPRVWQITEERKETLRRALEEYKIFPNDQAVLRAMLQEAGQ